MHKIIWERLCAVLTWERAACRTFSAWTTCVLLTLLREGSFEELSFARDISLLRLLGAVAICFVFYTVIAAVIGASLHADSWFLLLTATACVWYWLVNYGQSSTRFLFTLAVAVAYLLFLLYAVRANLSLLGRLRLSKTGVWVLALAAGALSCAVIATITCLRYKTFSSPNFDFGLFCNMFYNMKESGLPLVTCERDRLLSHFAVHISPVYYLILPLYYVFPSPLTLQIAQAVALCAGVVPVVLLARHHRLPNPIVLLLGVLYAFYPVLSTGCFYDLHENCFLPLFLLFTFFFYEKRNYLCMYLFAILTLSVKEDAAVYLLLFALFVLLSERNYLHGGILAAVSIGYFLLCGYLLTRFGTGMMINRFDNLIYNKEEGLLGAVKTALANPGYLLDQLFTTRGNTWEKVMYVLQMLLPLGLLPFCTKRASRWLLVAPLLINLLTYYTYQYDIGFQYHFGILAFLFYAVIKNLPDLELPTRRTLLGVAVACCLCFYLANVVPKLTTYTERWENGQQTYTRMEEMLDTIPEDASVTASSFLIAHIADRDVIYELQYHQAVDTEYVVFDLRYKVSQNEIDLYLNSGYEISAHQEKLLLILKRVG